MTVRFSLRQLEYFVAVGEAGSISQAAEQVNVSSPSISAAIAQLESEFGLSLFVRRHAQGLTLTQSGRQLMETARTILGQAEALNRQAIDLSGTVQGPLALGCLVTFAQMVVPRLRRGFSTQYPQVRITQTEHDHLAIINKLRRAEIDIALSYNMEIPSDLEFVALTALTPYAMMHPNDPLATKRFVTPNELAEHPMILLDLPISSEYFLSFFGKAGLRPNIAERTRDMAVARGLVANGFGFSIANIRPLNDLAPDGQKLRFVPIKSDIPAMQMGLVMAQGAMGSLTVRAFVEACQKDVAEGTMPGLNTPIMPI